MEHGQKKSQMINNLKINRNVCRICLDNEVILNWNEDIFQFSSITYKECYYKYTELQENAEDNLPTNLCEVCAHELKNSHLLFKKALKSFKTLQAAFKELKTEELETEISANDTSVQSLEITISDDISEMDIPEDDMIPIDVEDDLYITKTIANKITKNAINFSKELQNNNDVTEARHFIDIKNCETSCDSILEQPLTENICTNLPKASASLKKFKNTEQCTFADTLLEQEIGNSCDVKTFLTSTNNKALKRRKKNLLMCAYCSLKVNGTNQLKKHEATHSENRKRTEICPQCGIKLYTKIALNNHIKIHDENRQKKYKCEFCEKAFFNRGGLNVHRRIHLGLMVPCLICSKEFFRQIDLDKHLLSHSVSPLQKSVKKSKYTVQCQYCNKSVLTNKWKEHKAAHLDQPQVKCTICDKKFFARSKCVKHLRRLHRKSRSEDEHFIHYFVDCKTRMSHLMIKQQEKVQPITE